MSRLMAFAVALAAASALAQYAPAPMRPLSPPPPTPGYAQPPPPPPATSHAPGRFDLSGQFGWQVSPTFYFGRGVKLTDSGSFGGSIGWRAAQGWKRGHGIRSEVFYLYQPSGLSAAPVGFRAPLEPVFGLSIHHFQAAALYELGNERVRGFFGLGLGGAVGHPHDSRYGDLWMFSASAQLGVKLRLFAKVGLRAQARLLIPFLFTGGGIYCGTGGCGVGITGGGALLQADFTGGPYLEFG